ncbi:MAG: AAA family ATPase [Proteobacteria bacterium]|nr:AAA family ATPase [Pseudomonadota bacterium]
MRVASIRLKNFKRFTDLEVRDIPSTAKLVVVVGPNGCGKSSLFDGLNHWYRGKVGFGNPGEKDYFRKNQSASYSWDSVVRSLGTKACGSWAFGRWQRPEGRRKDSDRR